MDNYEFETISPVVVIDDKFNIFDRIKNLV
jgi:hypothetical protein